MTRPFPAIVPALLLGAAGAASASGAAASPPVTLTVSATVLPRTAVTSVASPTAIVVSADDVRRGYVDVGAPTRLLLSNNAPRGFAIDVFPTAGIFTAVNVRSAGAAAFLGRDGGTIVERSVHGRAIAITLSWRFMLADDVTPGLYPWPLQLTVRALADDQ